MNKRTSIILAVIISLLLLVAQTGYWYNQFIINPTTFKETFYSGIRNEASRHALADEIVNRGLANRPLIQQVFGDTARSAVYSLLETDFFRNSFDRLVTGAHRRITTNGNEDLAISLIQLKAVALPIIERINPQAQDRVEARQIPDQIVILRQADVPSVAKYTPTILLLGWLSFLAIIPLTIFYFLRTETLSFALKTLGIALSAVFLFTLIAVATAQPVLLANIVSSNIRLLAENILQAFLTTYFRQLIIITLIGLVLLLIGYLTPILLKEKDKVPALAKNGNAKKR